MTVDEMTQAFEQAKVPYLLSPSLAATLAAGLGVTIPARSPWLMWTRPELAEYVAVAGA